MKRVIVAVLALTLTACLPQRRGEPITGEAAPLSAQEERGMIVFMANCQQCHPGGEAGLGPSLNDKPLPGFLIKFQVRQGLGAMPAFDPNEISDEDLDALVAYIVRLRLQGVRTQQ